MKIKSLQARGQALIVIALAAIGLFAVTGLAIDGSAKFSDRRHAQNAADTAALAGALGLARGDALWSIDAANRALENGYDDNHVSNEVQVNNPPTSGVYSNCSDVHFDCHDYVEVIIDSNVNTFFARVIGIGQTHNHVEAVASKVAANDHFNFGGNAVVALSPDGCALMAQGNSNVTINGGGLYSNSDENCSFKKDTCAGTLDVNNEDSSQGAVSMVGGYTVNTGCMPDAQLIPGASKQISFPPPYQTMAEPSICSDPVTTASGSTVTLSPGHYSKIPPSPSSSNITLQPGVYCIDTTLKANAGDTLKVSGTSASSPGVFLYFKAGGSFTFNGSATVQLWGIDQDDVDSNPSLAPYKGFLMYLAPNYSSGTPSTCTINGNTSDQFIGAIYAPYCNATLDGTSDPTGFQTQIIAYTVKFAGGANVILNYDGGSNPTWNIPLQVGLAK